MRVLTPPIPKRVVIGDAASRSRPRRMGSAEATALGAIYTTDHLTAIGKGHVMSTRPAPRKSSLAGSSPVAPPAQPAQPATPEPDVVPAATQPAAPNRHAPPAQRATRRSTGTR